jgi:predicted ester cyclase
MTDREETEDRKAVVRRVYAALDAGDQAALAGLIDDGFRLHLAGVSEPLDLASMAAFGSALYGAFPDLHHTVLDQLEDGNRVATRLRMQGTHRGAFEGIAPTGSTIDVEAMNIHRVVDGRVVEQWAVLDQLALLRQIGAV